MYRTWDVGAWYFFDVIGFEEVGSSYVGFKSFDGGVEVIGWTWLFYTVFEPES